MPKHTDWMRTRRNAAAKDSVIQFEGRKLLGRLMEYLKFGRLFQGKLEQTLADGTRLVARFDGTTPIIEVYGVGTGTEPVAIIDDRPGVWVPRGFVLYPASDDSARGWGLPVEPAGPIGIGGDTPGPYDTANLAPGLDVTRWTAAGPLGQVLLTQVGGAGYPARRELTSPLMYHPTAGIRPERVLGAPNSGNDWTAYRMEFSDLAPQSPNTTRTERNAIRSWKRAMFTLTNDHRDSVGRDKLTLPIRGYYDSAQATAEVEAATFVQAHFYQGFAVTYRTTPDRFTKDGGMLNVSPLPLTSANWTSRNGALGGAENLVSHDGMFTVIGTDPNGIDILQLGGAGSISPSDAFDKLLDSAIHKANIESTVFDLEGQSAQSAATLSVGYKAGFAAQHFTVYEQWIGHGNVSWTSEHDEIPVLSWQSFNSANLTWETWPVKPTYYCKRLSGSGAFGDFQLEAVLTKAANFVQSYGGAAPISNVLYTDIADDGATDRRTRTALSPRVFARGRCIGVVPRGGLVWAAAVQKIAGDANANPPRPDVYRLIVLAHHADEQMADEIANGMTSVLHVWYHDMPIINGLACNPRSLIRDVYGEEDTAWPWNTINSPYSWRDGGTVNVAGSADLLKYASLWRFDPTGLKAICLRDVGTVADYERMFVFDRAVKPGGEDRTVNYDTVAGVYRQANGHLGHFTGGPRVCALELLFDTPGGTDEIPSTTLLRWSANAGGVKHRIRATFESTLGSTDNGGAWVRPAAADYDADGNLVFAHHVSAFYWLAAEVIVEDGTTTAYVSNWRQAVLFGDYDAVWSDAVASGTFYSTLLAQGGLSDWCTPAVIVDVRDQVWATVGRQSPATDEGVHPDATGSHPQYPDYLEYSPDSIYRQGVVTADCDACTIPDFRVKLWRGSAVLDSFTAQRHHNLLYDLRLASWCDDWFNTSGAVGVPVASPGTFWGGWCSPAANPCLSVNYARLGDAWMASIVYLPQAGLGTTLATSGGSFCPVAFPGFAAPACINNCGRSLQWGTTLFYASTDSVIDGGGWVGSSFATQSELAAMMEIPGSNVRSLTLGVV